MKRVSISKFIRMLRNSDKQYIEAIYTMGGCYRFSLILVELFPGAEVRINEKKDHVATLYKGKLYDIRGELKDEQFTPLTSSDRKKVQRWSFYKNNMLQVGECPYCEEPKVL